jgi:hypothetical protein
MGNQPTRTDRKLTHQNQERIQNRNLKNTNFVHIMTSKVLRDLPFSRNQTLKSADQQYIRISKNKLIKLKKQEESDTVIESRNMLLYLYIYINTDANSVMLYLRHDFYNITFKTKNKLVYTASGSALPAKNSGCAPEQNHAFFFFFKEGT